MPRNDHWYPWFHRDWLTSTERASMDSAARGIFRDICDLVAAWGSVPADRAKLALLCHCERTELERCYAQFEHLLEPAQEGNGDKGPRLTARLVRGAHTLTPTERGTNPRAKGTNALAKAAAVDFTITGAQWRRVLKVYKRPTFALQASEHWRDMIERAPDPRAEADRVLGAALTIRKLVRLWRLQWYRLPNLRDFIAKKRYIEDWEANAERQAEAEREADAEADVDPQSFVPPWEGGEG